MRYLFLLTISLFILQSCSSTTEPPETLSGPSLLYPAHDTSDVIEAPLLEWSPVAGATSYYVEISSSSDFNDITDSATVSSTSYRMRTPEVITSYYWRVRAINGTTQSTWSEGRRFKMIAVIHPVAPGTILTYLVQDLQTAQADTMTMTVMEQGITFDGHSNVMRLSVSYRGSTSDRYMKYEENGNISFFDDGWVQATVGTKETYASTPDTIEQTSERIVVSQSATQYDGAASFSFKGAMHSVDRATLSHTVIRYSVFTGNIESYDSFSAVYAYSHELRFLTSFQRFIATTTTSSSMSGQLIGIQQ